MSLSTRPEENQDLLEKQRAELIEKQNAFKFEVETELLKLSSRFEFYEAELKKRDEVNQALALELKQSREENKALKQEVDKLSKKVLSPRRNLQLEFLDAIESGLVQSIEDYKTKGVLWSVNDEGKNALHLALANPDLDTALNLANELFKCEATSEYKNSRLQLYNMHDLHGLTPVQQVAKYKGKIELIKYLYAVGDLTANRDEFSAIYDAACQEVKDYLVKRKLLESSKRQKDNNENEQYAEGDIEGVQDALSRGADINAKSEMGNTALSNAVYYKYEGVIRILLAAGADPTIRDNNNASSLDLVISSKNPRDIEFKKLLAPSFLLFAAEHCHLKDIQKALRAGGADILLSTNSEGKTALQIVMHSGRDDVIRFLLQKYAEAKIDTSCFLLYAAERGSAEDIKKVLEIGGVCDLLAKDAEGKTALHKVVLSGNKEAINCLLKKYAEAKIDISIKDNDGKIPDAYIDNIMIKRKSGQEVELKYYIREKYGIYKANAKLHPPKVPSVNIPENNLPILSSSTNSFVANLSNQSNQSTSANSQPNQNLSFSSSNEWVSANNIFPETIDRVSSKLN